MRRNILGSEAATPFGNLDIVRIEFKQDGVTVEFVGNHPHRARTCEGIQNDTLLGAPGKGARFNEVGRECREVGFLERLGGDGPD